MVKTTNNRELLRNYKSLKEQLIRGELEEIIVPQKEGVVIKLTVEKIASPFEELICKVKEQPLTGIRRPEEDLF